LTDDFWQCVQPLIPPASSQVPEKVYVRKPGAGRPAKPERLVFEAIIYVLRTGCQWKALPKERFGSASAIHKRFLQWEAAGFFQALWEAGLAEYEQMQGIAWHWQINDDAKAKMPSALQAAGGKSAARRKKGQPASPVGGRSWRPVVAHRKRSER